MGPTENANDDNVEILEEGSRSIMLDFVNQMRKDMEFSRISLPTFLLEPRSMLERITDSWSHPGLLLTASKMNDPLDRFVQVVRFYLSGWHVKPKGVRKPYNPVLGEFFRCRWIYEDGSQGFYVAEQVSHHPPVSTYYFASPENGIVVDGETRPRAKFLGNSVVSMMNGLSHLWFTHFGNEQYDITVPNVYARGILLGKMFLELGDKCSIRCHATDLVCEMEFKTKGLLSGSANGIVGKIKRASTNEVLYEISGEWDTEMFIKEPSGRKKSLFNAKTSIVYPKIVEPEINQAPTESRRLWSKLTIALQKGDMMLARDEKLHIEEHQRLVAAERHKQGLQWHPQFFVHDGDQYKFKNCTTPTSVNPIQTKEHIEESIFSFLPYSSRGTKEQAEDYHIGTVENVAIA